MKTFLSSGTSSATRPATQWHFLQNVSLQRHSSDILKSYVEAGVLGIGNIFVRPVVKKDVRT